MKKINRINNTESDRYHTNYLFAEVLYSLGTLIYESIIHINKYVYIYIYVMHVVMHFCKFYFTDFLQQRTTCLISVPLSYYLIGSKTLYLVSLWQAFLLLLACLKKLSNENRQTGHEL